MKIELYLSPCTKWIQVFQGPQYKTRYTDTLNLIEEEVGRSLELTGMGGGFSEQNSKSSGSRIDKWDLTKLKSSYSERI